MTSREDSLDTNYEKSGSSSSSEATDRAEMEKSKEKKKKMSVLQTMDKKRRVSVGSSLSIKSHWSEEGKKNI